MSPTRIAWRFPEALRLAKDLENALDDKGWHVALGGSVLHAGRSSKDVDLFVYPHTTAGDHLVHDVRAAMLALGFRLVSDANATREIWRELGSEDQKSVEVYRDDKKRRVDVFIVS